MGQGQGQQVLEKKPQVGDPETYPNYRVILINDDHNTFEHVANCLMKYIPEMTPDRAWTLTEQVHYQGAATVWCGPKEVAELYYEQLKREGLTATMEPEA